MKQTKNHKLNLVEMSDTFSTDPLNENMEIIDAALKAVGDTAASISRRVGSLEDKHVAVGSYRGPESGIINIYAGFEPRAVLISGGTILINHGTVASVGINKTGFAVGSGSNNGLPGKSYSYVAFD